MDPYVHGFVDAIVPATNTGRSEVAPALNGPPSTLKGPEKKPAEKPQTKIRNEIVRNEII